MSCADFDRGIDRNGKMVTMPDMPSSCVEEMRKSGIECEGYSSSLGQAASGNRAKSAERQAPPNYIKLPSGYITPKHECSVDDVVCVDCTFLSDQVCYEQADKVGLINHNIGFGPGQKQRWSCFLRQAVKVDSAMKRVIHHEDAETVFG